MELTPLEARIIGVLLEKELTTPEQYPLSLNALTLGCNQKSSRFPVLSLSETEVQAGVDSLNKKRLISEQSGFGSRVVKYKHRFCNTEFSDRQFSPAQVAIICLLLLRGPQTAGELRTRSNRLHGFTDVHEVEQTLHQLAQLSPALAIQLAKEPGKREARFDECFTPSNSTSPHIAQDEVHSNTPSLQTRANTTKDCCNEDNSEYTQLRNRVSVLEQEVDRLKTALADLLD
ncbi:YceH family protein [uncultured Shewanella sp.]|uniref:YceH family protein n=1 Tax=uncultured Shewanella sp. TaxID=173975 RepID=UPI00261ECFF3|nr:YceH family protein [uncultured Shewanella sp.]